MAVVLSLCRATEVGSHCQGPEISWARLGWGLAHGSSRKEQVHLAGREGGADTPGGCCPHSAARGLPALEPVPAVYAPGRRRERFPQTGGLKAHDSGKCRRFGLVV